jgi:large subunit ribosomal protein L23
MQLHDTIIKPHITEKSMTLAGVGKFSFIVDSNANKDVIKKAIEKKYSVHVKDVATSYVKGKRKRVGVRRAEVQISRIKKAIVTLATREKLDMFELGS